MPLKPNARQTIQGQNTQLDALMAVSDPAWSDWFGKWKAYNVALLALDDAGMEAQLRDESAQLKAMIASISTNTPAANFWRASVSADKADTDDLVTPTPA